MSEEISYADAQRYPGGIEKFLFDKVMELEGQINTETADDTSEDTEAEH